MAGFCHTIVSHGPLHIARFVLCHFCFFRFSWSLGWVTNDAYESPLFLFSFLHVLLHNSCLLAFFFLPISTLVTASLDLCRFAQTCDPFIACVIGYIPPRASSMTDRGLYLPPFPLCRKVAGCLLGVGNSAGVGRFSCWCGRGCPVGSFAFFALCSRRLRRGVKGCMYDREYNYTDA